MNRDVAGFFTANDPWRHLVSTKGGRMTTFPFTSGNDLNIFGYVALQNLLGPKAAQIHPYDSVPMHVYMGEDAYENYIGYDNPRYFVRWGFWSWLLSGGSYNYGGIYWDIIPYSLSGQHGLDSVGYIWPYFQSRNVDLSLFQPAPSLMSDNRPGAIMANDAESMEVMRRGTSEFIAYHPNYSKDGANASGGGAAQPDTTVAAGFRLDLTSAAGTFSVEWYRPYDGVAQTAGTVTGGAVRTFTAPWVGYDAVLRLLNGGPPPPPDTQPPTVPTGLTATAVSSSQINLSWTASTDNVGVTGYRIYRGGTQIATTPTTTYSDTGLSPSTSYTYTVAAYDAAGNVSAQSSPASATTLAAGSGQPPVVSFTNPIDGAMLSGTVAVNARANDPDVGTADGAGIANVVFELRQGTAVIATLTEFLVTYDWSLNTTLYPDGVYTLRATATSTAAAGGTSTTVNITVLIANVPGSDSDGDGLPDAWEWRYFGSLAQGPSGDPDGDGYTNLQEYLAGSDPTNPASVPGGGGAGGGGGHHGGCGATGIEGLLLLGLLSWARRRAGL